jgi:hypothetical protein
VRRRLGQHLQLLVSDGEQRRGGGGIHDLQRVRVEGDEERAHPGSRGAGDEPIEDVLMPAMHAVEGAHGGDRFGDVRREGAGVAVRHR